MSTPHDAGTEALLGMVNTTEDPVLAELEARADREGFPTVGPAVGRLLRLLCHATAASRVFECGSGFGYSAYWMARGLPPDGEIVLTERDRDELADARAYFEAGDLVDRGRFEHGDAVDLLQAETGSYDVILIDHEKERYPAAFDVARERIAPGGLIIADNACETASYESSDVVAGLREPAEVAPSDAAVAGVVEYYRDVMSASAFETALVPLGEGLLVSTYSGH